VSDLPPELRIVEYQNEWITRGTQPFRYERFDVPQLAALRERYHLEQVIAAGDTEWSQLLLLCDWVRSRWDHGWSDATMDDALDILGKGEQGLDFACGYTARTLLQCALALGFQARSLSLGRTGTHWLGPDEGNVGHATVEVWAQDWRKWAILDPDLNVHFLHQGAPQHALDLHRLWKAGRWQEVQCVRGRTPARVTRKPASMSRVYHPEAIDEIMETFGRYHSLDYYCHLSWELRNDYFSRPGGAAGWVHWFDHTEPPQLVRCNHPVLTGEWTCDEREVYGSLNQAQINLRLAGPDLTEPTLRVQIHHSMPNLDRIDVRLGENGYWQRYTEPFNWSLARGMNVIEAKPVSRFGRAGYTSRVVLRYMAG
jgi:hypothetical protein